MRGGPTPLRGPPLFSSYLNAVAATALDNDFDISKNIEMKSELASSAAVEALGALAQEHRLSVFRLLVQTGAEGLSAGAIAVALSLPNSSLSFHLAQLHRAGLIIQHRRQRSLIYRADYSAMNRLVAFLTENCCSGADCSAAPASGAIAA